MPHARKRSQLIAALALTSLTATPLYATPLTWNSPTDAPLLSPTSWSPSSIPTPADDLLFSNPLPLTATLSANAAASSLSITNGELTLDLQSSTLTLTGPFTYTGDANSTLKLQGGQFAAGSISVTSSSTNSVYGPIPVVTSWSPISVIGSALFGATTPDGALGVILFSPLSTGAALTVGDAGYVHFGAYAPVSVAGDLLLGSRQGATEAAFVDLAVGGDARVGTATGGASATFDGATRIAGSLFIGDPLPVDPSLYGAGVTQDTPDLSVVGNIMIASNSGYDLRTASSGTARAKTITNFGRIIGSSGTFVADAFLNTASIEPHDLTIDAPYTQTPTATLNFPVESIPTAGHLTLAHTPDWQGGAIHLLTRYPFTPFASDRIDLISSPTPLPVYSADISFDSLDPNTPFHLDTSHGLSIIFDADAQPAPGLFTVFTWSGAAHDNDFSNRANWIPASDDPDAPLAPVRFRSGAHATHLSADAHPDRLELSDGSLDLSTSPAVTLSTNAVDIGTAAASHASLTLAGNVTAYSVYVAHPEHSGDAAATLTLTPGSLLTVTDRLCIGQSDAPTVRADGALLVDDAALHIGPYFNIAAGPNSSASVLILGPTPDGSPSSSNSVSLATNGGQAYLELAGAASFTTQYFEIGRPANADPVNEPTASATALITGPATHFDAQIITLGGDAGQPTGLLTVADHASVSSVYLAMGTRGTFLLSTGGSLLLTAPVNPDLLDNLRSLLASSFIRTPDPGLSVAYLSNPQGVLLTPALPGDTNLDGQVDPNDLAAVDASFKLGPTDKYWQTGDFNYDALLNSADYLLIDRSYLLTHPDQLSPFLASRSARFGPAYASQLLSSIPEPLMLPLLTPAILLHQRRRKAPPT